MPPMAPELPEDDDEEDDMPCMVNGIRCINVSGTIGKHLSQMEMECSDACDIDDVMEELMAARDDENCHTILMMFNTPGGTTTGIEECGNLIADIATKKRCVAYTDTLCCSAGYWLASQCNEIYSTPSAMLGSIGVYCLALDETKALDMEGIKVNVFKAGKYKLSGASFVAMTDEEKAMFQADIDKTYAMFKATVKAKRNIDESNMEGLVFDGRDCINNGYIDGIVANTNELMAFLQLK